MILVVSLLGMVSHGASLNAEYEAMIGFSQELCLKNELDVVKIALIDTGIDSEKVSAGTVLPGKNYVRENTCQDLVGHGTRIASLIVGASGGEDSLTALAPNALIVPLVYYSKYPSGVPINGGTEAICQGIYDAVDTYACDIIVISSGVTSENQALEEAVLYAEENGVIVISAVGNDGGDTPYYPAAFPTVVGVGAVDKNQNIPDFSQKGESVAIVAPGVELYGASVKNGSRFEMISGTSYSCAYAAALAALLKGMYPDMTPTLFRKTLEYSATDVGEPGYDTSSGSGMLDFQNAVEYYSRITAAIRLTDAVKCAMRSTFYMPENSDIPFDEMLDSELILCYTKNTKSS